MTKLINEDDIKYQGKNRPLILVTWHTHISAGHWEGLRPSASIQFVRRSTQSCQSHGPHTSANDPVNKGAPPVSMSSHDPVNTRVEQESCWSTVVYSQHWSGSIIISLWHCYVIHIFSNASSIMPETRQVNLFCIVTLVIITNCIVAKG